MKGLFDDLNALKLSQDYADTVGVKKILATVPVNLTSKTSFVSTRTPTSGCRLRL